MLRHTQATVLINQNVDIVTISKRLGHANPTTTQKIYAHQIKNSDEKADDKIEDVFYGKQQCSGKRHCCQIVDNNELILLLQKRKSLEIVMISRLSVGCGDRT